MLQNYPQLKKIIQYVVIFIVFIYLIIFLINYIKTYSFGSITVKTDGKNTITIIPENYLGTSKKPTTAGKVLRASKILRIKAGVYIVTVRSGVHATSKEITITSRKGNVITLDLPSSNGLIDAVGNINSNSFSVSNEHLLYLDQVSNKINDINKNDQLLPFKDQTSYKTLQWANPNYGIAQDNGGLFHVISQSGSRDLSLPSNILFTKPYESPPQLSLAANKEMYVLNGTTLYAGAEGGVFKTIGSEKRGVLLLGGANKLATIYRSSDKSTTGSDPSTLTVIDLAGKTIVKNVYATNARWSPSGKFIAVSSNGFGKIYDDSLNVIATIPTNSISNFSWLDDSTLYYSSGNMLWKFIAGSKTSSTIYTAPSSQAITSLSSNQDNSYLYFSMEGTNSDAKNVSIYKIPLNKQTINKQITASQAALPWLVGRCIFTLTNFNKPTIQFYDPFPEDNCPDKGRFFLQQKNIDPSLFNYSSTPLTPSLPGN